MKAIASMTILLAVLFLAPAHLAAQKSKHDTVKIKTSAECEMCKTKVETEVGRMKGVKSATLDLTTQVLTVTYNSSKTDPGKIRTVIANVGYDADDVKANNRAQKKLPDCCQPGAEKGKCDSVPK
ncbi:MAG TPA: heavy metal-associated domain-containing protein [Bacteroidia bacterium]|nr:heavy metal-associated domain-containing protein [Bacteroidia bacterium]